MFNKKINERIDSTMDAMLKFNKRLKVLENYQECIKCGHLVNKKFMKSEDRVENNKEFWDISHILTGIPPKDKAEKKIVTDWTCNICIEKAEKFAETVKYFNSQAKTKKKK